MQSLGPRGRIDHKKRRYTLSFPAAQNIIDGPVNTQVMMMIMMMMIVTIMMMIMTERSNHHLPAVNVVCHGGSQTTIKYSFSRTEGIVASLSSRRLEHFFHAWIAPENSSSNVETLSARMNSVIVLECWKCLRGKRSRRICRKINCRTRDIRFREF